MAKAADSKLTESSERRDRTENVIIELFALMEKVMVDLEQNRVTSLQTRYEIAPSIQKLEGVDDNIKGGCEDVLAHSCTNTRDR